MAKPTTLRYQEFLILVGNGSSPETFVAPCGLTSKGLDISASTNEVQVPDCDDPDAPAWVERDIKTLSGSITGSGILAKESFTVWRDWALGGDPHNVRVKLDQVGLGYYAGAYILSKFSLKAALGDKVQIDVTMDSDGEITWVAV